MPIVTHNAAARKSWHRCIDHSDELNAEWYIRWIDTLPALPLSEDDKRKQVRYIYSLTPELERDAKIKELAELCWVSERTVQKWLAGEAAS